MFLDALEKEIANEKKGGREGEEENEENDIDINEEFVERVLYARLSVSPSSSLGRRGEQINERQQNLFQSKFKYLLETFHRADGELRKSSLAQFANESEIKEKFDLLMNCLLYTSPSPRDQRGSRMPSSA